MAQVALEASLRGATLTRQLLAFSRRQPLEPKVFDMNVLVDDTVGLLRRTLGEQLEIAMVLAPDLWPVLADPVQLESAFAHLAINAPDATQQGGQHAIVTVNNQHDSANAPLKLDAPPGATL